MKFRILSLLVCLCLAASCTTSDEGSAQDLPPDPEESHFVNVDAKDDSQGIKEGSWEGLCVLSLVNSASEELLYEIVHSWPAEGIYSTRVGPDGVEGTDDDAPYENLEQLDAVRWVGYFTFRSLLNYAKDHHYCPEIGEETYHPAEDEHAQQVAERSALLVLERYDEEGFARRDAHPKAHGCVKAHMEVNNENLAPDDRVGLFSENKTYPAWIRFSNGNPIIQPDNERDVRGMAIKVMGVEGEKILARHRDELTQDFLLINGSAFFVRTPGEYVDFTNRALDGSPVSYFLSLDPREWKIQELFNLLRIVTKKPASPIMQYWSTTPFALGEGQAVKYSAVPCEEPETGWPRRAHDDFLHHKLRDDLHEKGACFDFKIQHQLHPGGMPLEDSTVTWDPTDSPFIKAATIRIPAQVFDSPEQQEFCEHLSFNPWHSLEEHRPLGGINRMRKVVYDVISDLRHAMNEEPRTEPTSHEF